MIEGAVGHSGKKSRNPRLDYHTGCEKTRLGIHSELGVKPTSSSGHLGMALEKKLSLRSPDHRQWRLPSEEKSPANHPGGVLPGAPTPATLQVFLKGMLRWLTARISRSRGGFALQGGVAPAISPAEEKAETPHFIRGVG